MKASTFARRALLVLVTAIAISALVFANGFASDQWYYLFNYDFDNGGYSPAPPFSGTGAGGGSYTLTRMDAAQCPARLQTNIKCLAVDVSLPNGLYAYVYDDLIQSHPEQHGYHANWWWAANTSATDAAPMMLMRGLDSSFNPIFRVQQAFVNNEQKVRMQCMNNRNLWISGAWLSIPDTGGMDVGGINVEYVQATPTASGYCALTISSRAGQILYGTSVNMDNSLKHLYRVNIGVMSTNVGVTAYGYHYLEDFTSEWIGDVTATPTPTTIPGCPPQVICN